MRQVTIFPVFLLALMLMAGAARQTSAQEAPEAPGAPDSELVPTEPVPAESGLTDEDAGQEALAEDEAASTGTLGEIEMEGETPGVDVAGEEEAENDEMAEDPAEETEDEETEDAVAEDEEAAAQPAAAEDTRPIPERLAEAVLTEDGEQASRIEALADTGSDEVAAVLAQWRAGELYLDTTAAGEKILFTKQGESAVRLDNGQVFTPADPAEVPTSSRIRRAIRNALDLIAVASPDPAARANAIAKLGRTRNTEYLVVLEARKTKETHPDVKEALEEAVAMMELADEDDAVSIAAIKKLGEMRSLAALDLLKEMAVSEEESDEAKAEARRSVAVIEGYLKKVEAAGTLFRGLSAGSVLLVVALGLAITFGLMGVINMAHGEMMAVGAYTTYLMQNIFGSGLTLSMFGYGLSVPGMKLSGAAYESYFLWAIPASFLMAGLVGIALERGVIRFLYKRPLESLLATWGISLILQQLFRLIFGANNVQVSSPSWLSGSFVIHDVVLGYNRVFVIGFAIAIVFVTWVLLTKTSLGLFIRAVMQNRMMASCMGVRTERVNMLTFGFGSGLAGLGGAFLSQLGNVGPNLGQSYIVDSFMTVVVGGVGNLIGTVCSAIGIGTVDQTLQSVTDPSMGKIITLSSIILFLLWRPGGLFPTRTRSLEG